MNKEKNLGWVLAGGLMTSHSLLLTLLCRLLVQSPAADLSLPVATGSAADMMTTTQRLRTHGHRY